MCRRIPALSANLMAKRENCPECGDQNHRETKEPPGSGQRAANQEIRRDGTTSREEQQRVGKAEQRRKRAKKLLRWANEFSKIAVRFRVSQGNRSVADESEFHTSATLLGRLRHFCHTIRIEGPSLRQPSEQSKEE